MKKTINVDATYDGMRIDRFLRKHFESIPQSLIERSLRNGKIKLNKKKIKSSDKVQRNDLVELHNLEIKKEIITKKVKFKPSETIIKENEDFIIENNDDFIVLNKQAGISVQGGTKSKKNLIDIFSNSEIFKDDKPYSVHRLDKETSGVFLIAKNRPTAQLLTTLFRLRKVYKTYIAICHGEITIKDKGSFKNNLIRYDETKKIVENAETYYEILDKNNNSTFIQLKPITGRKHQLRKQ
ncbi:RluA family pseudouridine synthase, partial [Candidatus Pelagibacter sp.]|nr:RluA family pseudouridine synthase [Candidatus Pelagibacter sp.]